MSDLPVIDKKTLASNTGDDPELAREVIDIFVSQTDMWQRLLDPQADNRQWADAAHTIKGAAASVGAKRLAAVCGGVEEKGRVGGVSPTEAAILLSDVKNEINDALEATARLAHELAVSGSFKAS